MTVNVGIYLFPGVEVLDFSGPYEVFTTACRVHMRCRPEAEALFNVFTVAKAPGLVRARAGLQVKPDYICARQPTIDVLIVPGGVVSDELAFPEVVSWIGLVHDQAQLTASVCTGAFLLAAAGLLNGKSATTHWEDVAELQTMFPGVKVVEKRRWVDQGKVVTSAGISAGIDMSLYLIERLVGRALAEATARQMEVDWHENRPHEHLTHGA
jgi:transcriptional regulator GlxA family with amidase domain